MKNIVIRRGHSSREFIEPSSSNPHLFTSTRPIKSIYNCTQRSFRESPWCSRFDLMSKIRRPEFTNEEVGTPRISNRNGHGQIGGMRVRSVFNPSYSPNKSSLFEWNNWASRDMTNWNPSLCAVRGSFKYFEIPENILPSKDESGRSHPPLVSSRLRADIRKQFILNGLFWVFDDSFSSEATHSRDTDPRHRILFSSKKFKVTKISESLRNMPQLVEEHRKENAAAKSHSWFEKIVSEMGGDYVSNYTRKRRQTRI